MLPTLKVIVFYGKCTQQLWCQLYQCTQALHAHWLCHTHWKLWFVFEKQDILLFWTLHAKEQLLFRYMYPSCHDHSNNNNNQTLFTTCKSGMEWTHHTLRTVLLLCVSHFSTPEFVQFLAVLR